MSEVLRQYFDQWQVKYEEGSDLLPGLKSDFYFPEHHLLIAFHKISQMEGASFFAELAVQANQKGVRLIQIWEDQWQLYKDIILSRLKSALGDAYKINARDCSLVKLPSARYIDFLNKNHLNVSIDAKYRYGLIYKYELVAVMGFSRKRMLTNEEPPLASYEMLRFCSRQGLNVVGAMGKLLDRFIADRQPDHLMTYVDRDWSDGHNYETLGFELVDTLPPITFYLDPNTKQRLYQKPESSNLDLQEVYNSGSLKMVRRIVHR